MHIARRIRVCIRVYRRIIYSCNVARTDGISHVRVNVAFSVRALLLRGCPNGF